MTKVILTTMADETETMKTMRLHGVHDLRIHEEPVPLPAEGELLLKINAAVRWLSIEPLLGALKLPSLVGIHWVVVGGESGKNAREMKKAWVTLIRDACEKDGAAFYFNQVDETVAKGAKAA